jgi:hypothetical protein
MRKGKLTRDEAIEIAGIDAVEKLDSKNCDFTNRVQTDGDTAVEFSAAVGYYDRQYECDGMLIAYYYQEQDELDKVEDLSLLDWIIEGYEVR